MFITNAPYADVYIVFAKTDPDRGTRGISAFIVEKDTPGFSVGEAEHKMGIRGSSTPPIYFSDCRIPKKALLGEEGEGFKVAMRRSTAVGSASPRRRSASRRGHWTRSAPTPRNESVRQTDRDLQAIQWMIADMATEIDAARLLATAPRRAWTTACLLHRGRDGEALRLGDGNQGGEQGDPDPRRIRLYRELPGGAELP